MIIQSIVEGILTYGAKEWTLVESYKSKVQAVEKSGIKRGKKVSRCQPKAKKMKDVERLLAKHYENNWRDLDILAFYRNVLHKTVGNRPVTGGDGDEEEEEEERKTQCWETGGERPLGRPRRRWEDNIKMDLRDYDDRDWINLQDRDRWRAFNEPSVSFKSHFDVLQYEQHDLYVTTDEQMDLHCEQQQEAMERILFEKEKEERADEFLSSKEIKEMCKKWEEVEKKEKEKEMKKDYEKEQKKKEEKEVKKRNRRKKIGRDKERRKGNEEERNGIHKKGERGGEERLEKEQKKKSLPKGEKKKRKEKEDYETVQKKKRRKEEKD
ncbi:hypothetical protein ANN_19543 [Periplaneta americana]|uniref:Uncharacterized protein n=1 Tax=Periplaneta americana TaxID=6978 RepID=A0ABQ8SB28_PERAM|nr:hypothetical protein ANN_19543 [Periplaneta americana]